MVTARAERRLAAILAADVVGYSSLMERDEDRTLERLKARREELVEPLVAEHCGRVVKLMGDGALCEFASVVDAVRCAVLIQQGTAEAALEHPRDLAWRAAACGHLGQTEEAWRCGGLFVAAVRRAWRGDPAAGPAEHVDWLVDASYLRRPEDAAHLREGLRLASLPA